MAMKQIHIDKSQFKKVTIISAHEGSYSWVKTLSFMENYINLNYLTIISDAEYRSSNIVRRILNKIFIYLVFPLKILTKFRSIYKQDYIIVITSPFYMPLLASLIFKREKLLVLHNDLYPEGFYFLKQSLRKTYQVKLGQSVANNIIIGKSITISDYIRWYYPKYKSIEFLVSGSTIGWCDISKTWIPIYSHPEYLPYIHSRPSIILHYMTLTGNIIINNRKFKDLLEIRSQQYEDDYQKNVLNKLNI